MLYLDTSALIPYLVAETQSEAVERVLTRHAGQLALSWWTQTECASALSKKVRAGECKAAVMPAVMAQLEAVIGSMSLWLPSAADHQTAIACMSHPTNGLRAGDALHLAIAKNHGATLFTLDAGLVKAARTLKIGVKTL